MNARETCKHGKTWGDCFSCIDERFEAVARQLVEEFPDPMAQWKAARRASRFPPFDPQESDDDLLPTHPRFTVEDQIFLHRRCAIKL